MKCMEVQQYDISTKIDPIYMLLKALPCQDELRKEAAVDMYMHKNVPLCCYAAVDMVEFHQKLRLAHVHSCLGDQIRTLH